MLCKTVKFHHFKEATNNDSKSYEQNDQLSSIMYDHRHNMAIIGYFICLCVCHISVRTYIKLKRFLRKKGMKKRTVTSRLEIDFSA